MAWLFSLSAECGSNRVTADAFAAHFHDISWALSSGKTFCCNVKVFQEMLEPNWWCVVCPINDSKFGVIGAEDAKDMTDLGYLLYQRLRSAPPFRYALVGIEVDEFRSFDELISDDLVKSHPVQFSGLVVSEDIWRTLGNPDSFTYFSPNHLWIPYNEAFPSTFD